MSVGKKRQWSVVTYQCPYLGREVSEIWDGILPCIPVNAYLRAGGQLHQWSPKTVQNKAYCLLAFVRWLADSDRSFWNLDVRLGGRAILEFRNELLRRVYPVGLQAAPSLADITADDIMGEILGLCRYWRGAQEQIRGEQSSRRDDYSRNRTRPAVFRVKVTKRAERGKESLRPEEIDAVWNYFLVERRPPRRCPSGLVKERWHMQTALWARECMVWALFMCTGLRRGEAPAVMLEDVRYEGKEGWWVYLVDPREARTVDARRREVLNFGAKLKNRLTSYDCMV